MRSVQGLVVICGVLAGCSSMGTHMGPEGSLYSRQISRMTSDYNAAHGTHYPVPSLTIDAHGLGGSVIGAAAYSNWTIHLNAEWIEKDVCMVTQEALPHELAHLFVYYDRYGPPRNAVLPTPTGPKLVAMNGPGLQDLSEEHGSAWQKVARELGADPCKEGYCYSPQPYKKFPLQCATVASGVSR